MNTLRDNTFTRSWQKISAHIPRPQSIVSISAHWYIAGTRVTASAHPKTIHDFSGFPKELYDVQYPAMGNPALAARVQELLLPVPVQLDDEWGLDHGTWSVLCHVFPGADIPVIQLSIDRTKDAAFHYELGKKLAPLREEGVLVMASGNVVHNLGALEWGNPDAKPYDWAERFDRKVRGLISAGNHPPLIDYPSLGPDASMCVPTPDHYLPLLYILGMQKENERIQFPVEGIDRGSISMMSIQAG